MDYTEYKDLVYKFAELYSNWNNDWNDSKVKQMWETGCKIHNLNEPYSKQRLEWMFEVAEA